MKVILINPAYSLYGGIRGVGGHSPPINLCYLAGYAKQQHKDVEFKILDAETTNLSHEKTADEVQRYLPDLIGITTTTCGFDSAIILIKKLKTRLQKTPIIIGGAHASALPEHSILESNADFASIGEAEITFSEIISQIKVSEKNWHKINGLAYRDADDTIKITELRELIPNLDTLPFPARDLLDNNLYTPSPTKRVRLGPYTLLSTSRGCPCSCKFCANQTIWKNKFRYRSPNNIIREIKECINKYGIRSYNLTDEYFTSDKKRVMEFCLSIIKENIDISWACLSRAEKLDKETLEAMKGAGCKEISFGIESGDNKILKKMNKHLDLNEASKVICLTEKCGIRTHASYMIGYLDETEETIKKTIKLSKRLNSFAAAFFIASPLPGTAFYQEALDKGYIRSDISWINYGTLSNKEPVLTMPELDSATILKWHRRAIRAFYVSPRHIVKRLIKMRGWHDILNIYEGIKLLFNIKNRQN